MAETPLCAYAAVDSAPACLVLTVLYMRAPWAAVRSYLAGEGPPPFAGTTAAGVAQVLQRMSESQVYKHLQTLRAAGHIQRARERCQDGIERDGFLLLITESQPVLEARPEGCQQRSSGSGKPEQVADRFRKTGPTDSGKPESTLRKTGLDTPENRTRTIMRTML